MAMRSSRYSRSLAAAAGMALGVGAAPAVSVGQIVVWDTDPVASDRGRLNLGDFINVFVVEPFIDGLSRVSAPSHPWEGAWPGVNPRTLARQTSVPIVSWAVRGGMKIDFALLHNSMATRGNTALTGEWLHSYDIRLSLANGNTFATVEWAHLPQRFALNGSVWANADGYRDTLAVSGTSFLLTSKDQTKYTFEATTDPSIHRLKSIKDPSGNAVTLVYDANGRLSQVRDPNGRNVKLTYNAITGRISQIKFTASTYVRTWALAYSPAGHLSKVTCPTVMTETGPAAYSTIIGTDPATLNITSITDRAGQVWQYGYSGDVAAWMQPPGNASNERFVYADTQPGSSVTDPMGVTLTCEYDGIGRLVRSIDELNNTTSLTYGDADYAWAPSQRRLPDGSTLVADLDSRGNPVAITPPGLGTFKLTFNSKNRLTKVLQPLVTDANGVAEPGRRRTDFVYDTKSRLIAVKEYDTPTTFKQRVFTYTAQGLLATAANEISQVTNCSYDAYGNLVSLATPGGRVFTWDFSDPILSCGFTMAQAQHVAGGPSTGFVYDELRRLRQRVQSDASGAAYHYDARDHLVKMVDSTGTSLWAYTAHGLPSSFTDATGWNAAIARDPAGRPETVIETGSFGQAVVNFTYDAAGRLAGKTDDGTPAAYTYDAASRLVGVARANGINTDFTFVNGLLRSVTHSDGQTVLADFDYDYQANGQLMRKSELDGHQTEYFSDLRGRLVSEVLSGQVHNFAVTHGYDDAGRRTSRATAGVVTTFAHDADGLVQTLNDSQTGVATYSWDNAGRLTSIHDPAILLSNTWDDAGRLIASSLNGQLRDQHAYDGLSRRVASGLFDAGGGLMQAGAFHAWQADWSTANIFADPTNPIANGWSTANIFADPCNPIANVWSTANIFADPCNPIANVCWGVAVGNPGTLKLRREIRTTSAGTFDLPVQSGPGGLELFTSISGQSVVERYPLTDNTGSRALTDSNGAPVNFSARYDAFGRTLVRGGEGSVYAWRADAGGRTEGSAGLIHLGGSAWFEPEAGVSANGWTGAGLNIPTFIGASSPDFRNSSLGGQIASTSRGAQCVSNIGSSGLDGITGAGSWHGSFPW